MIGERNVALYKALRAHVPKRDALPRDERDLSELRRIEETLVALVEDAPGRVVVGSAKSENMCMSPSLSIVSYVRPMYRWWIACPLMS